MTLRPLGAATFAALLLTLTSSALSAVIPGRQPLPGQVPAAVRSVHSVQSLPATNQLHFSISLPVRDQAGLDSLLRELYTPGSPHFRQYLTPSEYAERFGASSADYAALTAFVERNGLTVTRTYPDRTVLEVAGSVAAVENTFGVHMRVYPHPRETRTFYAPDADLSVDASLPVKILGVHGLDNYALPRPSSLHTRPPSQPGGPIPAAGTGPGGNYIGRDFRTVYLPANRLTGTGQSVALVEFEGYYSNDITAYETLAGLAAVSLTNVPVNGGISVPGSQNGADAVTEVSLDIEMVISVATNLSRVLVYEAPNGTTWLTMLKQIADDNFASQISSSWFSGGGAPNPAAEQVFQQMAAQGQSFFEACGDDDAYVGAASFPQDSPNITTVGGTVLTTTSRAARITETVWNRGYDSASQKYVGTGGGVSLDYGIPSWQLGVNTFLTNGGSATARNVPDVAMVAEDIYVTTGNGSSTVVGGTSCAAPLWAGVMALANQWAVTNGRPVVGFINPAIYEIANESIYNTAFFDVTTGSNAWIASPTAYFARPGYDLCTGVGVPKATNLLTYLVFPDPLTVSANHGFSAVKTPAGDYSVVSQSFQITNVGTAPLSWSLVSTSAWLTVSNAGGTLAVGAGDAVFVGLNTTATNLIAGTYATSLWFSNATTHVGHSRFFTLQKSDSLVVLPPTNLFFAGPPNGPFSPATVGFVLTNPSPNAISWALGSSPAWLAFSSPTGILAAASQAWLTIAPAPAATNLPDGRYTALVQVTNLDSGYVQSFAGVLDIGLVQNGDFETGDFTAWTFVGDTFDGVNLFDGVVNSTSLTDGSGPLYIHSGTYGMFLGDTAPATLSQSIVTVPGQLYRLSLWVDNPVAGTPQQFAVNWVTNGSTSTLLSFNNPPVMGWTNATFLLTATVPNSTLEFVAENPPGGFGLDDVTLDALTPPVFTSQPADLTIYTGRSAVLSGAVKGPGPMAYQWLAFDTNIVDGGNISGANTATLTIAPAAFTNSGNYTLVVTNAYGATTSSVAVVTILIPPNIASASINATGGFNLTLTGTPGYPYILEVTTNLVPPIVWRPAATNTLDTNGVWLFSDASVATNQLQFYRLTPAP